MNSNLLLQKNFISKKLVYVNDLLNEDENLYGYKDFSGKFQIKVC